MMEIMLFVLLTFTSAFCLENSDDFINEINSKQNLWRAGRNFPENMPLTYLHGLLGLRSLPQNIKNKIPVKYHDIKAGELPESFDARVNWSKCKTIKEITDQSACGSCWAVSVASSVSDRICIHSNGKLQPEISSRNLMACADPGNSNGCNGGIPYYAWLLWKTKGTVTGGPFGSEIGCQPYPFAPCAHNGNGTNPKCPLKVYDTPECVHSCDNTKINYKDNVFYGESAYTLPSNEEQIRADIFKNGPLVAGFEVYTDFFHYKSGVYSKTNRSMEGRHAIRIIGWGVENGTNYWLATNSWNEDWGDNGLFKIRRGVNECEIESEISAGLPK